MKKPISLAMSLILLLSLMPSVQVGASAAGKISVCVTMSYAGSIITNGGSGKAFIDTAVSVESGSTVQDAVEAAVSTVGCPDNTFGYETFNGYAYISSYSGCSGYLGSAVNVNGTAVSDGNLSGKLTSDSSVDVALFSYSDGYPAKALYFSGGDGAYASSASVTVGGTPPLSVLCRDAVLSGGYFSNYGSFSGGASCSGAAVAYYTCSSGVYTETDTPFDTAGTVYAVATAPGCAPSAAVITVEPKTVYVTASYMGSALVSSSNGSAGVSGKPMICVPVALSSSGATVKSALTALAEQYYDFPASLPDNYLSAAADYWGVATANGLSYVASFIRVNGVETVNDTLAQIVSPGDNIIADMGSYDCGTNWTPRMTPTCIADTGGSYLGYRELQKGSSLSFKTGYYSYGSFAFSLAGAVSSGCSIYVTKDTSSPGTALTASSGTYSYTFSSAGTYYIVAVDTTSDQTYYGVSAERIVVSDSVTNSAPTLKTGVFSPASASTYVGKPYTLDLSSVFKDVNGDALLYAAKVDSGSYGALSGSSYSYTPTAAGSYTLAFKASDGTADSGAYSVTLTVTAAPACAAALSGLSAYYSGLSVYTNSNDQWGIADLMAYNTSKLTGTQKAAVLEQLISDAGSACTAVKNLDSSSPAYYSGAASCAGTLARCIITMKSLGFDAEKIKAGDGTDFDAVSVMNGLIAAVNGCSSRIYTQPYMLMALQEFGTTYAAQITALKTQLMAQALSSGGWGYSSGGSDVLDADTFAPVILALSPYYSEAAVYPDSAGANNTVKTETDACLSPSVISGMQSATGAIYSWGSDNVCSTGLVTAALVAVGKDPSRYARGGKSLVDGLLLYYGASDGYGGPMYNDQAFRGLAAYTNYASGSAFALYDFSGSTSLPAYSSLSFSNCPVYFSVIPSGAAVSVANSGGNRVAPVSAGIYDLTAGSYTYSVAAGGYLSKTGSLSVSSGDVSAHTRKTFSVSLSSAPVTDDNITVAFSIKAPKNNTGYYTYKSNSSAYTALVSQTLTLKSGSTVFDALDAACAASGISYAEETYGYISKLDGISQFDYGSTSGWLFQVGDTVPTVSCRSYPLRSDCSVTWFYSDDYTKEYGSESWAPGSTASSETTLTPSVTASGGAASVSVSISDLSNAIQSAKNGKTAITIAPTISGSVTKVSVELSRESVSAISSATSAGLTVKTSVGTLTLPDSALASIAAQSSGGPVTISLDKAGASDLTGAQQKIADGRAVYGISVLSGGSAVTRFGGGSISISLPYTAADAVSSAIAVWYLSSAGRLMRYDCTYDKTSALASFTTKHLSYYFVAPSGLWTDPYSDVATADWFYSAAEYTSLNGLMSGSGSGFSPNTPMTRAMLVTVLYRMDGAPGIAASSAYTDISGGEWYTDAVSWATQNGIVSGYGSGVFGASDRVTREQAAKILCGYAKYKGFDVSKVDTLSSFTDAGSVSGWAGSSVGWAVAEGLMNGTTATTLSPCDKITRAQAAALFMRLDETIGH